MLENGSKKKKLRGRQQIEENDKKSNKCTNQGTVCYQVVLSKTTLYCAALLSLVMVSTVLSSATILNSAVQSPDHIANEYIYYARRLNNNDKEKKNKKNRANRTKHINTMLYQELIHPLKISYIILLTVENLVLQTTSV